MVTLNLSSQKSSSSLNRQTPEKSSPPAADLLALDEDAVGALEILDEPDPLQALQRGVVPTDAALVDADIAFLAAADDQAPAADFIGTTGIRSAQDLKLGHKGASDPVLGSDKRL